MKSICLAALVTAAFAATALADGAANAYVAIEAPGARNKGGLDFAVSGGADSVSASVKAQPGWELTSSPVVNIPKGSAGTWSAKSFYGESDAGGEICVPTTTVSTNHVHAPKLSVTLHVNHGNGAKAETAGNGNGGNKERGGIINIAAGIGKMDPGLHRIRTVHDSCPGGKSNIHTEDERDLPVAPDTFKWTWSVGGQSGTSSDPALIVSGVQLPRGKYTLSVTLAASSRACPACTATATASKEINIGNGVIQ